MDATPPSNWGTVLDDRRKTLFIGRDEQIDAFSGNLDRDHPRYLVLALHGQGGIGKSFLVQRYREIAREKGALSALITEAEAAGVARESILKAMGRLAEQLAEASAPLETFGRRYTRYLECMRRVDADPDAPRGAFDSLALAEPRMAAGRASSSASRDIEARAHCRELLTKHFSEDALRNLAFDLGADHEDLPAEGKPGQAREIIRHFERRARLAELVEAARTCRPELDWPYIPGGETQGSPVDRRAAWGAYVRRRFEDRDDVALLKDPVDVLTPLFVSDLNRLAAERVVVLCFDTWEWTGRHLDTWLTDWLCPEALRPGLRIVIAGRNRPGGHWQWVKPLMACFELEEFSEKETRDYLEHKGITDEGRIAQILRLAEGVPVLVSWLASPGGPRGSEAVGDLVELYLRWEEDPLRQRAALRCAAARRLDKDVVGALMGEGDAEALFDWLTDMPFVHSRLGYWEYHPKVRKRMLRHVRSRSARDANAVHAALESYHRRLAEERGDERRYRDDVWRLHTLESLYHGLMREWEEGVRQGLETFLLALRRYYPFAGEIVMAWVQAADELATTDGVSAWAGLLVAAWAAMNTGSPKAALRFSRAARKRDDLSGVAESEVYFIGGLACFDSGDYERAITDFSRATDLDTEYAAACSNRGNAYSAMQDYQRAIADFSRAIELDPGHPAAYYNRGLAYYDVKDYKRAIADYDRAIELDPELALAHNNRALAYSDLHDYQRAIAGCDRAIELDPELGQAYNNRGIAYAGSGDYERAIADFSQVLEIDPQNTRAYNNRGLAYVRSGDYERATADLTRALELDPELDQAYNNRGLAHAGVGDYDRAIADFSRAIELSPEDTMVYNNRGLAYRKLEDYQLAITDFSRAIELNPEYAAAYYNRGLAYWELEDYQLAIADYGQAIELDADDATAYFNRGNAYFESGDYERAIADLSQAIELDPQDTMAYNNRGLAYAGSGDYKRAITDFSWAIQLDPELAPPYYNRGLTYRKIEDYQRAITDLSQAIELGADDATVYNNRGLAYSAMQEYQRAIADYDRAIELDADDAAAYYNRGLTYYKMQDYQRAIADYDRAIELDAEDAAAYYNKASAYALQCDPDQACQWFEQAIALDEKYRDMARDDSDFDPIRDHPCFLALLAPIP